MSRLDVSFGSAFVALRALPPSEPVEVGMRVFVRGLGYVECDRDDLLGLGELEAPEEPCPEDPSTCGCDEHVRERENERWLRGAAKP